MIVTMMRGLAGRNASARRIGDKYSGDTILMSFDAGCRTVEAIATSGSVPLWSPQNEQLETYWCDTHEIHMWLYWPNYPAMYSLCIAGGDPYDPSYFDFDVANFFAVGVGLGIDGVDYDQRQNPGGFLACGGARRKVLLDVEPIMDLLDGYGQVRLMVSNGLNKASVYDEPTGGTGEPACYWDLPGDWGNLCYYITNGIYVGATGVSSSLRDVQLTLDFVDHYGDLICSDAVNFTAVELRIEHPKRIILPVFWTSG